MPMVPGTNSPSRRTGPSDFLDQMPAGPVDQDGATAGLTGGPVTPPGMGGPGFGLAGLTGQAAPGAALQGMSEQILQIDQALLALAQAAPIMGPKLGQCRTLLQQAMAEFLSTNMSAPSPTGPGFPGGGFNSAR